MQTDAICPLCGKPAKDWCFSVHCISKHCANYDAQVSPIDLGELVEWAKRPDAPWRGEQQKIQDESVTDTRRFQVGDRVRNISSGEEPRRRVGTIVKTKDRDRNGLLCVVKYDDWISKGDLYADWSSWAYNLELISPKTADPRRFQRDDKVRYFKNKRGVSDIQLGKIGRVTDVDVTCCIGKERTYSIHFENGVRGICYECELELIHSASRPEAVKREFQKGDRVWCFNRKESPNNKTGRIEKVVGKWCAVRFDDFQAGHTCELGGNNNNCWWCKPDWLELIHAD